MIFKTNQVLLLAILWFCMLSRIEGQDVNSTGSNATIMPSTVPTSPMGNTATNETMAVTTSTLTLDPNSNATMRPSTVPTPPMGNSNNAATNETLAVTPSPVAELAPNECETLLPSGATVGLVIMNSDPPDQVVYFTLREIPATVKNLYITDKAWNGEEFVGEEGTVEFSIPDQGIPVNKNFGYGSNSPLAENWTVLGNTIFDIGAAGDTVLLYCLDVQGKPHFLHGVSSSGPWAEPGFNAAYYGTNTSALPSDLIDSGSLALPHFNNYVYIGPGTGGQEAMIKSFSDPDNYKGSNIRLDAEGLDGSGAYAMFATLPLLLWTTGIMAMTTTVLLMLL